MKTLYVLLLLMGTPWMFAQTLDSGVLEGTVIFGDLVAWGQVDLPAGAYSLTIEYAHAPARVKVRSDRGKTSVLIPLSILAGAESGHNRVCLVRGKDRWQVRSVDLPQMGISLLFSPRNQPFEDARSNCVQIAAGSRSGM